jgi:hypothetical protein
MLFAEIVGVCGGQHTKRRNTLCGQSGTTYLPSQKAVRVHSFLAFRWGWIAGPPKKR